MIMHEQFVYFFFVRREKANIDSKLVAAQPGNPKVGAGHDNQQDENVKWNEMDSQDLLMFRSFIDSAAA
jgi:hypothetical protein